MSTKSVDVAISEELVPYLNMIKDGKDIEDKLTLAAVFGLFVAKLITLEKAAELTGKSVCDFIDILEAYEIPWCDCAGEQRIVAGNIVSKAKGG